MSSHWKLANTPCAPLTREETALAVAELQLCSLPSAIDPSMSLHDIRIGALHMALCRLQVPLCRTAKKLVSECVRHLDRQSMKPGEPVIPVQEFLRLLSQLKTIYSMWRSAVLTRSSVQRRSASNGGQQFFADDLAEALESFCEEEAVNGDPRHQRMVCLPLVESAVNEAFGQQIVQPASDPTSPASPSEADFGASSRQAAGLVGIATLCRALLNGDFVTDLQGAAAEDDNDDSPATFAPRVDERIDLVELRRRTLAAADAERSGAFSQRPPQGGSLDGTDRKSISPPVADLKPLPISNSHQVQQKLAVGSTEADTLLLAMSIDVPKCPRNLRLHPEDSDSDEMASARKSSRRMSKGKLSGRFRMAAHQALHLARASLTPAATPPVSAKPPKPVSISSPPPSPSPVRPLSRSVAASAKPQQRTASLTHRRSVTPAAGILLPSLADHTALTNPVYERYKQQFPKRIVQFR